MGCSFRTLAKERDFVFYIDASIHENDIAVIDKET
jgi:hypothetical protein